MEPRSGRPPALLVPSPRRDDADQQEGDVVSDAPAEEAVEPRIPDLGDLVVVLLAGTLAGLRDRLAEDGFAPAAELVADLVDIADDYLTRVAA
jgi:hypothetical protein